MAEFKLSRLKYTWRNEWSSGNTYYIDDIISYGSNVYVCLEVHNSESGGGFYNDLNAVVPNTSPPIAAPRWEKMMDGYTWTGDWQANVFYNQNDIVKYGGTVYRCVTQHTSDTLFGVDSTLIADYGLENDQGNWVILARTEDWKTEWLPNSPYRVNDIVKYGGIIYRCITPHISAVNYDSGLENDIGKWQVVHSGIEYLGTWAPSIRFKINDIVKYGARSYICINPHSSAGAFNPANWSVYAPGLEYDDNWHSSVQYQPGDVVKYGGYAYTSLSLNQNAVPTTSALDWELLSLGYNLRGDYNVLTSYKIGDVIRRNGILYACIQDAIGTDPTNSSYWEVVVTSFKWQNIWTLAENYELNDIVTFDLFAYRCIARHTSTASFRPDIPGGAPYWELYSEGDLQNTLRALGDIKVFGVGEDLITIENTRLPIGASGQALTPVNQLAAWEYFNNTLKVYYVSTEGVDAAGRGTTLQDPWRTIRYACANVTGPATIFIKTGYYEEILPISIPAEVALVGDELRGTTVSPAPGYELQNMFYVRNATGIRNMTLTGLSGSLSGFNQYLTKRPTAGAYVSLDPGSSTNDSSVWITTRSPYVQNVTTFGTGCIGLKVDGNLHDGGNKSIVANDFTQVLSDGIGAWVTNQGLSELVSVFTYYNHIGYLAENGGKIRGTNGNCSYGTYGAVAEGVSLAEIPITGVVNNRSGQATVAQAFSGQVGEQILILEYDHCGQDYSAGATTFTITGSGVGASVTPVTRNNAISNVRIKTAGDSSAAGGNNYLNVINNAQAGDDVTITLASSDTYTFADYQDMRILITSGTGTGQYGRIAAYDDVGKVAYVSPESELAYIVTTATAPDTIVFQQGAYNFYGADQGVIAPGDKVVFTGSVFGGLTTNTIYIIATANTPVPLGPTYITLTDIASNPVTITSSTGNMQMNKLGWDHLAGFAIHLVLDTSTQYSIEPLVYFSAPSVGGIRAKGRAEIVNNRVSKIKIWDCGSNYSGVPTVTIIDPNNTVEVVTQCFVNNGVLGPVTWVSRGTGYQTTSTRVTISGDGFAEKFQLGSTLYLSNTSVIPGPGDNLTITQINDVIYKVVTVEHLGGSSPNFNVRLTIFPNLDIEESPAHGTPITIRQKYSQVRLTGHDFLDIGVGNFNNTNYPLLYKENDFVAAPENEVYEVGGGRVFYTSTDQDGNFRVGELFKVEQSTGTVTISASFFTLSGLEELVLGGVTVGGTGTVIREFSKDSTFTADSNNIVPTQRAIKAYLTARISGGSSDAFTTVLTAGTVSVGPNIITTTTAPSPIHMNAVTNFNASWSGLGLGMTLFANSWDSDIDYTS